MSDEKVTSVALDAHFNQWRKITEVANKQIKAFQDAAESTQKFIQPIVEAQEAFKKTLDQALANQQHWLKIAESVRPPQITLPIPSRIAQQAIDLQKAVQASISSAFVDLRKTFQQLPARTKDALLLLGQHGWYLDLEMSLPSVWDLKNALTKGDNIEAETALVAYFESRLSTIEESISAKFPHRSHLIHAAFDAHRRNEYDLSIPVLLAQADGICKETVNEYLFLKHDKKPRTAIYVAQFTSDTYMAALLSPLAETLPIDASGNERPRGFVALNRHTVLHGDSLDYGTKINSLKSISLVNYVAHVLPADTR